MFEASASRQSGQIGVIILLVMIVVLTIGLSLAARTTQETSNTIQRENSTRVFSAAESGIEAALATIFSAERNGTAIAPEDTAISLDGGDPDASDYNVQYQIIPQTTLQTELAQGTAAALPLSGAGNVTIRWSKEVCPSSAALLIGVFSDSPNATARFFAVDGCASDRGNGMTQASADDTAGTIYKWKYVYTQSVGDATIRVMPIYRDTAITALGPFDTVQYVVNAQAQGSDGSQEAKAIEVRRTIPAAPSFMDFALVSGTALTKL